MSKKQLTVGQRIKSLRESQGLTQAEFSRKLGVSLQLAYHYETRADMRVSTCEKIAEKMGVSLSELFSEKSR